MLAYPPNLENAGIVAIFFFLKQGDELLTLLQVNFDITDLKVKCVTTQHVFQL
jgi:hypothetical protein